MQCHYSPRITCRDGESTRQHLISCSERYLRRRTVDGYTGSSAEDLAADQKLAEYTDVKLNGNANSYNIMVSPYLEAWCEGADGIFAVNAASEMDVKAICSLVICIGETEHSSVAVTHTIMWLVSAHVQDSAV